MAAAVRRGLPVVLVCCAALAVDEPAADPGIAARKRALVASLDDDARHRLPAAPGAPLPPPSHPAAAGGPVNARRQPSGSGTFGRQENHPYSEEESDNSRGVDAGRWRARDDATRDRLPGRSEGAADVSSSAIEDEPRTFVRVDRSRHPDEDTRGRPPRRSEETADASSRAIEEEKRTPARVDHTDDEDTRPRRSEGAADVSSRAIEGETQTSARVDQSRHPDEDTQGRPPRRSEGTADGPSRAREDEKRTSARFDRRRYPDENTRNRLPRRTEGTADASSRAIEEERRTPARVQFTDDEDTQGRPPRRSEGAVDGPSRAREDGQRTSARVDRRRHPDEDTRNRLPRRSEGAADAPPQQTPARVAHTDDEDTRGRLSRRSEGAVDASSRAVEGGKRASAWVDPAANDGCLPSEAAWPAKSRVVEPLEYIGKCEWNLVRPEDVVRLATEEDDVDSLVRGAISKKVLARHRNPSHAATFYRTKLASGDHVDLLRTQRTDAFIEHQLSANGTGADRSERTEIEKRVEAVTGGAIPAPAPLLPAQAFAELVKRRVHLYSPAPPVTCDPCDNSCTRPSMPPPGALRTPLKSNPVFVVGAARNHITVYNHTQSPGFLATAISEGWAVSPRDGEPPAAACWEVVGVPAFFFKRRLLADAAHFNVARFIHHVVYPMFLTVFHYVGSEAMQQQKFRVVPDADGRDEAAWAKYWAVGTPGVLLSAIFSRDVREAVAEGRCFRRAVFDCSANAAMHAMGPMQRYLEQVLSFRFLPLRPFPPAAPAASARRELRLLMFVRCPGGSRHLANWEDLRRAAEAHAFRVTVETRRISSAFREMLTSFQNSHLLVAVHGAELAAMMFMPIGSVVLEIVPHEYRYYDLFYVRQANSSGLHHVRVTPNEASVVYLRHGSRKVCGRRFKKLERKTLDMDSDFVLESGYRKLASNVSLSLGAWRTVLGFTRAVVAHTFPVEQSAEPSDHIAISRQS